MIVDIRDRVMEFLKETIDAEGIRVVRIDQADDGGWVAEAEVAEKNQYLASIKPEYRVFDKEQYLIKLNSALEIRSYKRLIKCEDELDGLGHEY